METPSQNRDFAALERALARRRRQAIDPWLRGELALLALALCAVLFWQLRVPFDGLARQRGPLPAVIAAFALLALIAAAAGALTAMRLARALRARPPGPAWLALPLDTERLRAHFAWNAGTLAPLALLPAASVIGALAGLTHWAWLVALGAAFIALLFMAARFGAAAGFHACAPRDAAGRSLPGVVAALSAVRVVPRSPRRHSTARASRGAALSLLAQDARLTLRSPGPRVRAISALLFAALASLPWLSPWAPRLAHSVAFGLCLLAAAACADWVIAVAGRHPASIVRGLPVGVARFWGTRALWSLALAALLLAVQATAASRLEPAASRVYNVWLAAAAVTIGLLGANLAVTLHPRADQASRVLSLWLTLSIVASFIIPLLGWVLLLTATIQSARRLPRWARAGAA